MNDLYSKIELARKYQVPPEGLPVVDRTEQVDVALQMAQRAASAPAPEAPAPQSQAMPIPN